MAYTQPPTFTDTTATTSDFNTYIRDNQRALKAPPSQNYESNEAGNYSTGSTTYNDVDSDFSFSITTTGGDVLICGSFTLNGVVALIDVLVDGTRVINQVSGGIAAAGSSSAFVSFSRIISGLSAGAHTFVVEWRVSSGGTVIMYAGAGTANYDVHPQFWVRELT